MKDSAITSTAPEPGSENSLEKSVRVHLGKAIEPESGAPWGDWVRDITAVDGRVVLDVRLGYPVGARGDQTRTQLTGVVLEVEGVESVLVNLEARIAAHVVQGDLTPLPGVKNIIAVASAKGGVGKSTVAANMALALAAEGARVGLLDADIYGPSQPRMLGMEGQPEIIGERRMRPKSVHGIQAMSIGLLVEESQAMIWRGPMVSSALQQLLNDCAWENLDYLLIDLPPGTGDIQLTLAQKVPVSGAVVVTTPQAIAVLDARRGIEMFRKVNIPVLGVLENMSGHRCSACGHVDPVFGAEGGAALAEDTGVPLLGSIPLDHRIREQGDAGQPLVNSHPDSEAAEAFRQAARRSVAQLATQARDRRATLPTITISDD